SDASRSLLTISKSIKRGDSSQIRKARASISAAHLRKHYAKAEGGVIRSCFVFEGVVSDHHPSSRYVMCRGRWSVTARCSSTSFTHRRVSDRRTGVPPPSLPLSSAHASPTSRELFVNVMSTKRSQLLARASRIGRVAHVLVRASVRSTRCGRVV